MTETIVEPKIDVRRGLSSWLAENPVMKKELRSRMRGRRGFALLTAYLALLAVVVGVVYLIFASSGGAGVLNQRSVFGKAIFGVVVWMELLTVSFVAPALTAGAIASERERQTYDLLRTTLLSARALVAGKFLSAVLFIFLLIFAALPLQSLGFLFGGVAPEEIAIGTLILVVTTIAFSAAGMFFSSFLRRTLVSTVMAYAFSIVLVFGLPVLFLTLFGILNTITGGFNGQLNPASEVALLAGGWVLVCINPLATVIGTEVILLEQQSVLFFSIPLSNGRTVMLLSPWIPYSVLYLCLSALLLWSSVRFVRRMER